MTPDTHLKRLLERRTRALARHLPAAVAGHARGVHQARVASRRLREAVPIVAAGVPGTRRRRTRRALRRITRALGSVREMDVSLAALAERRWAHVDRAAVDLVGARLQRMRAERREDMLQRLDAVARTKLVARLRKIGALVADPGLAPAWRARLARRLSRRAEALRAAVADAGALYVPQRLHGVRIAAKKLRYALELAGEAQVVEAGELVRALKRTQDTLGRLHDLQVLIEQVQAVLAEPTTPRTVPPDALNDLVRVLDTECRALHARYVAAGPGLLELAATVGTVLAPRVGTAPAAGVRPAPLKMTLAEATPRPRRAGHRGR